MNKACTSVTLGRRTLALTALGAVVCLAACEVSTSGGGGGSGGAAASGPVFGAASAGALGCVSGQPEVLDDTMPTHMVAADSTRIYFSSVWGEPDLGWSWEVRQMGSDGSGLTLVKSGTGYPSRIAVDDLNVYLSASQCDGVNPCTGELVSFPKAGGPETVLYSGDYDLDFTVSDPDLVYIVTGDGHENSVLSVPKSGGALTVVASGFVVTAGNPRLAIDVAGADRLYWSDGAAILATPKDGAQPTTVLATANDTVWRVLVDAENVYWMSFGALDTRSYSVFSVPKSGGATATVFSTTDVVWDVAIDDRCLYWSQSPFINGSYSDGPVTVAAMPKAGGSAAVVDTGNAGPGASLTVDDSGLYIAKPAPTTPPYGDNPVPLPPAYLGPLDKVPR